MKLKIAFSSCPNDTFMFYALIHNKINTGNYIFDFKLSDIEKLNDLASENQYDVIKVSTHAFSGLTGRYKILNSGSAVGYENGPVLISRKKVYPDEIRHLKIAIPGKQTTANLLLSIAYPDATNKTEYLFSEIEEAVLSGETDAGLIIHETRFTYESKGLKKIIDLGDFWQKKTGLPVPLGCIIIRNDIGEHIKQEFDHMLEESIRYAIHNPSSAYDFVKKYAQEIDDEVIYKHIQLYVNDFSINLGEKGKMSIKKLYELAAENNIIAPVSDKLFI